MFKRLAAPLMGCVLLAVAAAGEEPTASEAERNWGHWRGPWGTGVAPAADPPVDWSESDGHNVRWKVALPGQGHSTPLVWGEHVFVTAAVPFGAALEPIFSKAPGAHDNAPITHRQRFVVIAVDRRNGEMRWQRTMHEQLPHEGVHYTASMASNSAVTDGQRLYAFFGSYGLYCLDFGGELLWKTDLGDMLPKHGHGEGSSPVLSGDLLLVNWDHELGSFVVAFDKRTGREVWKVPRPEDTSWASPIVVEHQGRPQLVISGTNRLRGYDVATGRVIWECRGLSSNVVASPVAGRNMVFAGSSYETRALLAIRLDGAEGDISGGDRVAWTRNRGTPYVPSPLLYDNALYFLAHYQGIMSRVDAETGEDAPGSLRLNGIGDVYASPVGAARRVYITDRRGTTIVISHDQIPRVLAVNRLDDVISASAAIAGKELFLRGEKNLYCLAEE
jgi:outer membrane protein assembly factor BamB